MDLKELGTYIGLVRYVYNFTEKSFSGKNLQISSKLKNEMHFVSIKGYQGEVDKNGFPISSKENIPIDTNAPLYEYLLIDFRKKLPLSLDEFVRDTQDMFEDMCEHNCDYTIN